MRPCPTSGDWRHSPVMCPGKGDQTRILVISSVLCHRVFAHSPPPLHHPLPPHYSALNFLKQKNSCKQVLPTDHCQASLVVQLVNNPPTNIGDVGLISGWERSLGEGNGNLLQYSYLGNPMDRGAWRSVVHGATKNQTWLSMYIAQFTTTFSTTSASVFTTQSTFWNLLMHLFISCLS